MRSIPFYPMIVLLLIGVGGYLGCDTGAIQLPVDLQGRHNVRVDSKFPATIPDRSQTTILIGSFNSHRLGPTKLKDPWVLEKLAHIIRRFDVIALQGITSKDPSTLPTLVNLVNQTGASYSYVISAPVGRQSNSEQYAFVFDTAKVRGGQEFSYLVQDQQDTLHREPFVGRFRSVGRQPFTFTLINMHTDPDEVQSELDILANVFVNVRQYEFPEDDVLLLGDLNAGPDQFQRLGAIHGLLPVVTDQPTDTRKSQILDNILLDATLSTEFTGRAGTLDLESMFSISSAEAARISDHLPVWAEFNISEIKQSFSAMAPTQDQSVR